MYESDDYQKIHCLDQMKQLALWRSFSLYMDSVCYV